MGKDIFRRNFWLMAVGVALQMLSGIFFLAGAIRTVRDVKEQARQALIQYLSENE